jgi:hypothetical protein
MRGLVPLDGRKEDEPTARSAQHPRLGGGDEALVGRIDADEDGVEDGGTSQDAVVGLPGSTWGHLLTSEGVAAEVLRRSFPPVSGPLRRARWPE